MIYERHFVKFLLTNFFPFINDQIDKRVKQTQQRKSGNVASPESSLKTHHLVISGRTRISLSISYK